jgi:hypothetical protein
LVIEIMVQRYGERLFFANLKIEDCERFVCYLCKKYFQ